MKTKRILIIEDDKEPAEDIMKFLRPGGEYEFFWEQDAEQGALTMRRELPDLIILDIIMQTPKAGKDFLRVKATDPRTEDIPVIIYSRVANENFDESISQGAKWVVSKSEGLNRLRGYVIAALDQNKSSSSERSRSKKIAYNPVTRELRVGEVSQSISLTRNQSKLLEYLSDHYGEVCTRIDLAMHVYEARHDKNLESIDATIRRLRVQISEYVGGDAIRPITGVGYMLKTPGA